METDIRSVVSSVLKPNTRTPTLDNNVSDLIINSVDIKTIGFLLNKIQLSVFRFSRIIDHTTDLELRNIVREVNETKVYPIVENISTIRALDPLHEDIQEITTELFIDASDPVMHQLIDKLENTNLCIN